MRFLKFIRDDRAAASIEILLWTSVHLLILNTATNASLLALTHIEMRRAAEDAQYSAFAELLETDRARRHAGEILLLAARSRALGQSNAISANAETRIDAAAANVSGFSKPVLGQGLSARVVMRSEQLPTEA